MATAYGDAVIVYKRGVLCCSVCAPASMEIADVVAEVNRQVPCGTENGWTLSSDELFSSGEPNGYHCTCDGKDTRHWLLDA